MRNFTQFRVRSVFIGQFRQMLQSQRPIVAERTVKVGRRTANVAGQTVKAGRRTANVAERTVKVRCRTANVPERTVWVEDRTANIVGRTVREGVKSFV